MRQLENEQTTPETEVSQGLTEEQAVSQMLGRWAEKETPKAEEETPQEQVEETTAQVEEESEQEEVPGEVEIDVAGEKFKVPTAHAELAKRIEAKAKEVEAGATRKFQEAADLRKATEAEAQAVKQLRQFAERHSDLLADHKMVANRMQALEKINLNEVDTDTLTRLNAEFIQLQAARGRIENALRDNAGQMAGEEQKAMAARIEHANKVLSTRIKDWGPDRQKQLAEYAVSKGAPQQALSGITEAWMIEILDDAAYGHSMRQAKPQVTKKVADTPQTTVKPTGAVKTNAQIKADIAMSRVKKTGSIEDAANAFLARAQMRKR